MELNNIYSIEELGQCMNAYVLELENTTEFSESVLKDTINIINSLVIYEISILCEPEILSHKVFTKFRICYYTQLNSWRRGLILSNYERQALLKLGSFFNALSEHVNNANINIFEQLLFDKKLIEELCSCLTDLVYRIDDPNIESIGYLVLSFRRIQDHRKISQNNSLQDRFIDAIIECLTSSWYEMCLCAQMTDAQKFVFSTCVDYILDCTSEYFIPSYNKLFTTLLTTFPQWFYEQAKSSPILTWNEQIIFILSKLISILTNQIWKYDHEIDEIHNDSYKKLTESLLLVLSTISIKHNQIDVKKNDLMIMVSSFNI